MARVPGQPALRKTVAGLLVALLVAVALWWFWPRAAPQPTTAAIVGAPPAAKRVLRDARELPAPTMPDHDATLREAASGEHGLALRNRVCRLCVSGAVDDPEACKYCGDVAIAGRVVVDLVGDDGRPIKEFDGAVGADCQKRFGFGNGGPLDLPEGPCTLRPYRFDGALLVHGPPVEVQITADTESYQLLEVPAAPHGGVGLSLKKSDDGFLVEGLIPETAAMDAGGFEGMALTAVDGTELDPSLDLQEVLDLLVGPMGTEVEVTFVDADGRAHTKVLDRRRILGGQLRNVTGQPG